MVTAAAAAWAAAAPVGGNGAAPGAAVRAAEKTRQRRRMPRDAIWPPNVQTEEGVAGATREGFLSANIE